MYKVDPTLFEKFKSNLQTKSNNNDPNPLVYITRNRTPITTQRFWEKLRVTSTVGTRSSIAVRRPEGNLTGDMIFVAQVESGNAVISKAQPRINLTDMVWSHVATLNNVSELSIMFDGYMKMVEGKVESYTTGDLPVVFYVDSDNSLKGWNMNNDVIFTISDTAHNVASVRGLYSEAADLNDGIFVFYTNASGELWEARVLNDEVTELTQITLKPEGVTGWEDVWASLTFDYRVVLQLKGTDGNTYSLLSSSRPSGFSLIETFSYNLRVKDKVMFQCGTLPPNIISVFNYPEVPLSVYMTFDSEIFIFDDDPRRVWLQGRDGRKIYPIAVTKTDSRTLKLLFGSDLIGLLSPQTLKDNTYYPCGFGSIDGVSTVLEGNNPILYNIDFSSLGNEIFTYNLAVKNDLTLEMDKAFDGKGYAPDETFEYNLRIVDTPTLEMLNLEFVNGFTPNEIFVYNLKVVDSTSWVFLNVDGTPV